MRHFDDAFQIFQFHAVQIQSCFFYVTMFLICDDVRSEYMSAHVRIDSSYAVGSSPPRLFVAVGLA